MAPTTTERITVGVEYGGTSAVHQIGGNEPSPPWPPHVFYRFSITRPAQTEEEAWADLAARARASWARENPA